jgi:probable F420-dependent oxidoreductase
MKMGIILRNMGPAADTGILAQCARAADESSLDSVWVVDHVAIPPDGAEGSGGLYLDVLATLAFLAGHTQRISIGSGVLVLPYRPPLMTARSLASIQALSGNRLLVGAGIGWMEAEFRALGLNRAQRGRQSDETLDFIHQCFSREVMEANGQPFLFRPKPPRPPIYIGGKAPHALTRAVKYGDGWFPIVEDLSKLREEVKTYRELARKEGRDEPEVVTFGQVPLEDSAAAQDILAAYRDAGVTHFIHGLRYDQPGPFFDAVSALDRVLAA